MELAEAVRILRDQTIPALRAMWRDWYPVHVAALEAVLDAPAPARRDRYEALSVTSKEGLLASEWVARTGRAEAEVARLRAQWDAGVLAGMRATAEQQGQIVALTGEVERLRADLAAWPGKWNATLDREARWIEKLTQAEAERDELRADLSRTLAEVERLKAQASNMSEELSMCSVIEERAERAEAERDALRAEVERLRIDTLRSRAYRSTHRTPGTHSSACITWGDDGQGGILGGGTVQADACSCGAWPAWLRARAERAEAALKATQDMLREEEEQRRLARIAAEAERDALRANCEVAKPCTHMEGYVEKLEAERDALRGERRSLLEQLGRKAAERDELLAEVSRSHAAILALTGEVERLRAVLEQISGSGTVDGADARAALSEVLFERDALRATLREIEQATEGIPEANCALANRIARVALAEVNPADDPAADLQAMGAPAEEPKPEMWRCVGCGETFDGPRVSHGRHAHAPGCTGSCDGSCPIQVECGPVERLPAPAEGPHCPHGNPPGSARDCACRTEKRHWQNDAEPQPGRAQAAYQAEVERGKP